MSVTKIKLSVTVLKYLSATKMKQEDRLKDRCHKGMPVVSLVIPSLSKSLFRNHHHYEYFLFLLLWD